MKNTNEKTSSEKENRKVNASKQPQSNEVREDQNNSINEEGNDKSAYPYKNKADKQYKIEPEFIDRNSNSKDKS